MRCALLRGLAALVSVVLVVGALELSSTASARRAARTTPPSITDAVEPGLPIASEVSVVAPGEDHALTR